MKSRSVRTWIEISRNALRHNVRKFFHLIHKDTRFMAVIKSNAYGHGLVQVAQELSCIPAFVKKGWFGVDSIVEALGLRREGIQNPILVLGFTLPDRIKEAVEKNIRISISNFNALNVLASLKHRPEIHIKIDTGMHRQGFLSSDIQPLIRALKKNNIHPEGIFTHFSSAKDPAHPAYTFKQLDRFNTIVAEIKQAGFSDFICHAAATGGVLLSSEAHLDMVRIGMGLYGYWPSEEWQQAKKKRKKHLRNITLTPVLAWKTIVSEVKKISRNARVGYDGTETMRRNTTIAVLPVGYWHGYDRGLSSIGRVLVRGSYARVVGRVSMDMIVVDVTDIRGVNVGDEVVLIGAQGKHTASALDPSGRINTSPYEFLTRINPLIQRTII